MSAAKTRLTPYIRNDGVTVYAARITAVAPMARAPMSGAKTLTFGELGKQAHLIPKWVEEQNPEANGYFVVDDHEDGKVRPYYVNASTFAQNYKKKEA